MAYSSETKTMTKLALPSEVSSQLPIFQILGNQIPDKLKSPETQKTLGKGIFWLVLGGLAYGIYTMLPTIISFLKLYIFGAILGTIAITISLLYPKIISLFHTWGSIMLFKSERGLARMYGIETLELSLQENERAQVEVRQKITKVEGVQVNFVTEADNQNKLAENKLSNLKKLTVESGKLETEGNALLKDGKTVEGNEALRKAKQYRVTIMTLKSEYENAMNLAKTYAQGANQFAKALEYLKDNESGVKMYVTLLRSSIKIAREKLEASGKMKSATDGLAGIFDIKNKWQFQVALGAVQEKISDNLASVRRNLEFLQESNIENIANHMSQDDIEKFISDIDGGKMTKFDVAEVVSPYHTLSQDEKVDAGFNIFN